MELFPGTLESLNNLSIMKAYPLGIDNPIRVRGIIGTTKWALYWRDDDQKIATFSCETNAYEARRAIIEQYQKEKE